MVANGFSCVLCEQTLCLQGATRYAFIASPCPSLNPLSGRQAGARRCTSHGPLSLTTRPTPFRAPLVRCSPNRDVTPCHASDIFDINDSITLKDVDAEDHKMWTSKKHAIVVNLTAVISECMCVNVM